MLKSKPYAEPFFEYETNERLCNWVSHGIQTISQTCLMWIKLPFDVTFLLCVSQCGHCGDSLQSSGYLSWCYGGIHPPGRAGKSHRRAAALHVGQPESGTSSGERRQPGETL